MAAPRSVGSTASQAGLQFGVGDPLQVAPGPSSAESTAGQAPSGVATVPLQVLGDYRLQQLVLISGQGAALDEDSAQGLGLVQDPGAEGGQQASRGR